MKSLKIWSLVALIALAMTACGKTPGPGGEPQVGGFDKIEQEWKLVSVNGTNADFSVYMSFSSGMFAIYQQVYTIDYKFFEGEYEVSGNTLSGSYFDGGDWKCDYTGGITDDGKTMTLKSTDEHPMTFVYEACTIPQDIKDEALGTRAEEAVVPFL